jgi:spermidine/putrescine transport system permease protein
MTDASPDASALARLQGRGTRRLLKAHALVIYLFLYGPIVTLIVLSFNAGGMPTAWTGFSFKWYGALIQNPEILKSVANSLAVALAVTLISTAGGTLLALGLERGRPSTLLDSFVMVPMIIPDIVLAIALLSFYTLLQFTLGLYTIVLSQSVFVIAFAAAVVRTRLRNFDRSVIEASIDLGAGAWTTFRRVTLPIILPGVIAAALLSFTLSIDDFVIAYFSAGAGSGSTTFPMKIYAMIRFGVTPEINAIATLLLLVSFTLMLLAQRFSRESGRGSGA